MLLGQSKASKYTDQFIIIIIIILASTDAFKQDSNCYFEVHDAPMRGNYMHPSS